MKKYVIQDVEDDKYYCDGDSWSDDINDATLFEFETSAWDEAFRLNHESNYITTVLTVII